MPFAYTGTVPDTGLAADGAQLKILFATDIKGWLTGKNIGVAQMADDGHHVVIGPFCPGDATGVVAGDAVGAPLAGVVKWIYGFKLPFAVTKVLQAGLFFNTAAAGAPVVALKIKHAGTDLLSTELTNATAGTEAVTTVGGFAVATIASGETLTFEVRNNAAAGNDAKFVSCNLVVVAAHRTAA